MKGDGAGVGPTPRERPYERGKSMFHKASRPRHAVIDESGRELEDTVRFPRLHAAATLVRRRPDDDTLPFRLLHDGRPNTGPDDLQGIARMPFTVHRDLSMRPPTAPRPASVRDFVRLGFQMAARELDQLVRVLSSGWQRLASENDRRMAVLDERLARLAARHNAALAAEDGRLLDEAYARGGTELVRKLTPEVLARMDARAKAGTVVAR